MSLQISLRQICSYCLALCLFATILGIGAQNIAAGLFTFFALLVLIQDRRKLGSSLPKEIGLFAWAGLLYVLWLMLSSFLNPANNEAKYIHFFFGYLPFFLLPVLVCFCVDREFIRTCFFKWGPWVAVVWFIVALSQSLWGWSLIREIGAWQNYRPHGFFSHPLSLAYAALVFLPLSLHILRMQPKRLVASLMVASVVGILILTNSRTCLIVAGLLVAGFVFFTLRGQMRLILVLVLAALTLLTVLTDNRVSRKFAVTMTEDDSDRLVQGYADDRLAFWHAHWVMVQERPLLGHGMRISTPYVTPYYEQIGLADFPKKYNAHNQFLQVLANGGFIGFFAYLAMFLALVAFAWRYQRPWLLLTVAVFILASITQNSFNDAVVRNALTMCICLALIMGPLQAARVNAK